MLQFLHFTSYCKDDNVCAIYKHKWVRMLKEFYSEYLLQNNQLGNFHSEQIHVFHNTQMDRSAIPYLH